MTFIGAQFGRTLSRFEGTAPNAIRPLYSVRAIIAALNVPLCIQKHRREVYSSREISVENTGQSGKIQAGADIRFTSSWSRGGECAQAGQTICNGKVGQC